jgi:hypothetical protein
MSMDRQSEAFWGFLSVMGGLISVILYHSGWWAGADTGSSELVWLGCWFIFLGACIGLKSAERKDQ